MTEKRIDGEPRDLSRREFLRLTAASAALAGLDGCTRIPARHILPYVDNRPELTPGVAQRYTTAMSLDGYATGLIVTTHAGRPTKVEGNPDHPASLGASGAIEQASVLQLYDPDRASASRIGTSRVEWGAVAATLSPDALRRRVGVRGAGLRLLIEPTSSLVEEEWLAKVLDAHPDARVHMYAPLAPRVNAPIVRHYDLSAADVIVAIDSDFLASGPFHLRYAKQFADKRRLARPTDPMNRLYVIESSFTSTGAAADHRFAVRPLEIIPVLRALRSLIGAPNSGAAPQSTPAWLTAIAHDLRAHAGRSVVVLGELQSSDAQTLADEINSAIGASERTTWYAPSPLVGRQVRVDPFDDLLAALRSHQVDTLVIVGGNPSYATPASLGFSTLLRAVPNAGYVGLYENETARDARWFVPMSHYMEHWGDARAYDGTVSIVQPLLRPLYRSVAPVELYATLAGAAAGTEHGYELLRASWNTRAGTGADEAWLEALQRGVVAGTSFARAPATGPTANTPMTESPGALVGAIDVLYLADSKVHDGAFANNGWLQELPAPLTQLTWGNAGLLGPATARRFGVNTGDAITLTAPAQGANPTQRRLTVPALVVPGHAEDTVTLHFGYGRDGGESTARGVGVNVYDFWPAVGARAELDVHIARANVSLEPLSIAQVEPEIGPNHPARSAPLATYQASPQSVGGDRGRRALTLYPAESPTGASPNQWAMTIDLGTCIGCGACMVACQAENNVPVVGATEVRNGRAMQWLRIDRYFTERESEVEALLQPMLCQQCEKAPCEYVCPVEATVHSDDGLNDMVYNRCVGTRFCSNNCPYKVRRFNWYDYNAHLAETELMVKNPNVTVRERGVMEKCTFCVQRIREAEIAAARDGRELRGSEVRTACQQACPTNAIVFGSLTERDSEVVRRREQTRAYAALDELGTEPRVRYLARIRNRNPDLPPGT